MVDDLNTPIILLIDDTPDSLDVTRNLLKSLYKVKVATSGARGLKILEEEVVLPDLVLLDIMMPEMDGYQVCKIIKANPKTKDIPIIFLTSKNDSIDEELGLTLGAADYISKPINPSIALARVKAQLDTKRLANFLKDKNSYLEVEIARRMDEVTKIQDVTIMAMACLAETRDNETGQHILRTQNYVKVLAVELSKNPKFATYLTNEQVEILFKSAPLHDIGKVGISDNILLKPGKLDPEEFEIMKTHTTIGRDAIVTAEKILDTPHSFLQCAREIAYSHQEKWDGTGYPLGLKGDDIPISARLMALADVYDALISKRVYKPAMTHEDALAIIVKGRDTHFDPDMVDAFVEVAPIFESIAFRHSD